MFYTIIHDSEFGLDCKRCRRPLAHAVRFEHNGELITVGRECAKHYYGIVWTSKVGPMAGDSQTFNVAVEIHKKIKRNARPAEWRDIKNALGSIAWKRAAYQAMKELHIL